jgi:hypothetical protein
MWLGFVFPQEPVIRIMQTGTYDTPEYWWRESVTHQLQTYLADDKDNPALYNNNFDAWRDSVMTMEVTLDDDGADVTALRLDIIFDNDIIDWDDEDTEVLRGSWLTQHTEGDSTAGADYSYEVVHYSDVGYVDEIEDADDEKSEENNRYDWLRITMVSHNGDDFTFGGGEGVQKQLIKLNFKIEDVADNFSPQSFRVPTLYEGGEGYYTYVSDDYLLDYDVYIDGNYGTEETDQGGARGDITLHPKLVDIEGYFRYIQDNAITEENTYPYWKIRFELDQDNPNEYSNWYNIEDIDNESNSADETTTDDVIGDTQSTFWFDDKGTTAHQTLPGEGFLGVSYYDSTYTDDRGYYNIQLPRNQKYRMSFYPPDASDDIETHTPLTLDRYGITNINDAIAAFNFQSNKFKSVAGVDTLNAVEYFIGDVDGDDVFQLNDAYFLWAYTSGILDTYVHLNGDTLQSWASIDTLRENNQPFPYGYYEDWGNQRYEFTIFYDDSLDQDTDLQFGQIEVINPLMDDIQTGLDTLSIDIAGGSSTYESDANPDYTIDSLAYFFTGDVNTSGTKVKEAGSTSDGTDFDIEDVGSTDGYIDINGDTFYRWGNQAPNEWANKTAIRNADVFMTLPADSTVRVRSGDIIEVPFTLTPEQVNVAGFEFEVEFNADELEFVDMKTGNLPGPWFTYVNVHEPIQGKQKVSFGGMDYSPGNAPQTYWIDSKINALTLLFRADFPDSEWTEAPVNFVDKYAAGNPSGEDLLVSRQNGKVLVWNKYWAFGGGEPDENELTYNYPNPFNENTRFQFYVEELSDVKLYILNSAGQYVGTLLDESVEPGIHTFDFANQPSVWLPEVSVYQEHQTLEPGVYIFVLQTGNKIKANKFTVVK